jgi:hypothetical protein
MVLDSGTCPDSPAGCVGSSTTGPISRSLCRAGTIPTARSVPAVIAARAPHEAPARPHARRKRVPLRVRHTGRVEATRTRAVRVRAPGQPVQRRYVPGESVSNLFGGNSNWRGPIWMPVNYLPIESLRRFHRYYGGNFKVECPAGPGSSRCCWRIWRGSRTKRLRANCPLPPPRRSRPNRSEGNSLRQGISPCRRRSLSILSN